MPPRRKVKRSRSPASMRRRSAATHRTSVASTRRPLATSNKQCDENDIWSKLVPILNQSQYLSKLDECVAEMLSLYAHSEFNVFECLFMKGLRRLLQSEHSNYLKQACQFLCKLLKNLSDQGDDRLVRSCMEVADHFMRISDEDTRLNAVFLVGKFLGQTDVLDEEIVTTLRSTLAKRIRDKKASIRSNAVLAACKFQDDQMIRDAFEFHFKCDPELSVRKVLIQTMDIATFGCEFLVEATQDSFENIRTAAYQRLAKVPPSELQPEQLHRVLHNGLFERNRSVSYVFRANMMAFWLTKLYDGVDLVKLLESLDVINYTEDINKLLDQLHVYNLEKSIHLDEEENATVLHQVVLSFKDRWLDEKLLPNSKELDERLVVVWLSLIKFCKDNQVMINIAKHPSSQPKKSCKDHDESIESITDSQETVEDNRVPLFELLMPDLIHMIKFLENFVQHTYKKLAESKDVERYEFIYQNLMKFLSTYRVGDDSELRCVQEVIATILEDNLLTVHFSSYIPPIIKCLKLWVFPNNSNMLVSYVAELINNIRSHLEDEQHRDEITEDCDEITAFKNNVGELLECLQMYYACLENANLPEVPPIMKNHLNHLSYEALDAFKYNTRVRVWIAACNGITAFLDRKFAQLSSTMTLLMTSCTDKNSLEIQSMGYRALVDIMIQHEDLDIPYNRLHSFLNLTLRDYGKHDPKTMRKDELDYLLTLVKGTAKLYYFAKLASAEPLAHLVMWWYHPRTHPMIRQYIGVFLPLFVKKHSSSKPKSLVPTDEEEEEQQWLEELLSKLFVISIEYLHSYILGPGSNVMDDSDMNSMINFLCNLVPTSFHAKTIEAVDERVDDLTSRDSASDLAKYLKRSKKNLQDLANQASEQPLLEPKLEPLAVGDPQNLFVD